MRSSGGAPICVDARTVAQSAAQFQGFVICRPVSAKGQCVSEKDGRALLLLSTERRRAVDSGIARRLHLFSMQAEVP
jgi:hypothetical protein